MTDSTTAWINAAGKRKLTQEQTIDLFSQLRKYREAENTDAINKTLNRICEGNLLLIVSTVNRYIKRNPRWNVRSSDELYLDLLQAGYSGLRVAAEKFDLTRNCKFSTCAVPWISQRLGRYLVRHEQRIYIPEGSIQELHYYLKHGKSSGRRQAPKGIAYVQAAAAAYFVGSLDAKVSTDEGADCLVDLVPNPSEEDAPRSPDLAVLELKEAMAKAQIPPLQQDLMVAYARKGRIDTAASKVGYPIGQARQDVKLVIAKLQATA